MEFINEILSGVIKANTLTSYLAFVICIVLYFIGEYKTRSTTDPFTWGAWLVGAGWTKDGNLMNILVSSLLVILYNISVDTVKIGNLLIIAVSGNLATDWILTYRYYRLSKK